MSDFSVKLSAKELGKSLENAADSVVKELEQAVQNLAHAAHSSIVANVQAMKMDPKNRADYLKGLDFMDLGNNSYVISLNGDWPNDLEDGFPGYDMKEKLLNSTKTVKVGSRAGQPWVRTGADGQKYAAIPFGHKPYAAEGGDLDSQIKKISVLNRQGASQAITKTFKDDFGKPIAGKVAVASGDDISKNLQGLTKYQHVSESGNVSSIYTTFRIISENSDGFYHPGFSGYNHFDEAEKYVEQELRNIVKALL